MKMSGPRTAQPYRCLAVLALLLLTALPARAQWITQTNTLKPGWNAVYLHVDASHVPLDTLVGAASGNKIKEIWLWQPPVSTLQFTTTPQQPSSANSQWLVWDSTAITDSFNKLIGNAAYLVNNTNTVDYVWRIKGKPVPPSYQWTTTGLNFLGFPTPASATPDLTPNFDTFLAPAPEFKTAAEIYRYSGGPLGAANPAPVFSPLFRNTFVRRGEAFWIRSGTAYNRYFGPVEINLQNEAGVHFADNLGTYRVRLKNLTSSTRTVTIKLLASEGKPTTTPVLQTDIQGAPPLLIRGALNTTDLTYESTTLSVDGTAPYNLPPDSGLEVVLGLDRGRMTATAGKLYAAVLRFTDDQNLQQVDVPVTATVASKAGLWVGEASVTNVNQSLKTFVLDATGKPQLGTLTAAGQPYVSNPINTDPGRVVRPYPLRLILHNPATGTAKLLQRVYTGLRFSQPALTTLESLLDPATLPTARRISATHLPFTHANTLFPAGGSSTFGSGNVAFTVRLDHNEHASNPFLHRYHPDHDNLSFDFKTIQVQGAESYTVQRTITLTFASPGSDFASLTTASTTLRGTYAETVAFSGLVGNSRSFNTSGTFILNRISPIATLTTAP